MDFRDKYVQKCFMACQPIPLSIKKAKNSPPLCNSCGNNKASIPEETKKGEEGEILDLHDGNTS